VATLEREVQKRGKALAPTMEYPLPKVSARGAKNEKTAKNGKSVKKK
jgi:hypothetical protein